MFTLVHLWRVRWLTRCVFTSSSAVTLSQRNHGRSVLAEMLSRLFIWIVLGFLLNKSGVICKSRLATLMAGGVSGGIRYCYSGGCLYAQNVRSMGRPPQTMCARLDRPVNALQFAVDIFHTKKLCSILSSKKSQLLYENQPLCVFDPSLPLGA